MSVTLEEMLEDIAITCDVCGGGSIDLLQVGGLKICLECANPKMECAH